MRIANRQEGGCSGLHQRCSRCGERILSPLFLSSRNSGNGHETHIMGTLLVLLAVACLHTVPIYPAKAQSLTPTGLDKNGLSVRGLEIMRTPVRPVANPA